MSKAYSAKATHDKTVTAKLFGTPENRKAMRKAIASEADTVVIDGMVVRRKRICTWVRT